jgi:predicted Zn finger-like uncharacterized protein
MTNMVTRCPQCQTSFRVTEDHLKIANGAVRCGSCLHVFQARFHWVNPDNVSPSPWAFEEKKTEANPVVSDVVSTDSAASADTSVDSPRKFQFDQSAIDSGSAEGYLGETGINKVDGAKKPPSPSVHVKLEEIGDDEKISDDLNIDDEEPVITPPPTGPLKVAGVFEEDYSSLFGDKSEKSGGDNRNIDSLLSGNFNELDENAPDDVDTNASDETWAKDILDEIEHEGRPEVINLQEVDDIHDILSDFTNPVDVDAARRDLGFENDDPFSSREIGGKKPDVVAPERAAMIAHIEPPPVEFLYGAANHKRDWKSLAKWSAVSLVLALLLVVQHVTFHFNRLAKDSAARPYIRAVCQLAQCKLPPVENWRYIKVSNLVLRKHPVEPDGLVLDAILFNVTSEEQPFPKLELYFSDMAKTPLASRRFEPSEYLSGEMLGKKVIPPGRPVHIALEVVSPGEKAVNWNLQVAGKTD